MSFPTTGTVSEQDSPYSWLRLLVVLMLGAICCVGSWTPVVVLPTFQAEFEATRAAASMPYMLAMVGWGVGGIPLGRITDRRGIVAALMVSMVLLGGGYILSGFATSLWQINLFHFCIGLGTSAGFAPLMADVSHWFTRYRGFAVATAAAGNYFAGFICPPLVQHFTATSGWRATHIGIGIFCAITIPLLSLVLRRQLHGSAPATATARGALEQLGISPRTLMLLLCIAGTACCIAMAMPQVHIVAYCGDLGYGTARGAEMLSLMLALGVVSRIGSGFVADRIGAPATLLISAGLQGLALFLYLFFDGLSSLYVISAIFGLFQGGIVPMYAILVRQYFPPQEAATRVGIVIMATVFGMAIGGWSPGLIFDLTGSYQAAFAHGLMWNLVTVSIAAWLLTKGGRKQMAFA